MARLRMRARSEEVGVSADYLERLHEQHESWLCGGSRPLHEWLEQRGVARRLQGERALAGRTRACAHTQLPAD